MLDSKSIGTLGVVAGVVVIVVGYSTIGFMLLIGGIAGAIAVELLGTEKDEGEQ